MLDKEAGLFKASLSAEAEAGLEQMAQKAHEITLRNFGRTIQLYTPMYLSNYCDNECLYCGFNKNNELSRIKLSLEEVDKEARYISSCGLRHILVLTGGSRRESPLSYIKDSVGVLKKYFDSISVEVYPLSGEEYRQLIDEGVDGLTIYQETYDRDIYARMHPAGPKSDYNFRFEAPERGARAGMHSVNIGALLGLNDWRKEIFSLGIHARTLQDNFPGVEVGVSLPRLRPQASDFKVPYPVSDRDIVQIITALRIFLPRAGISISTRENPVFRGHLASLGVTRMSAGSTTRVGGHTIEGQENAAQFEIADTRSVDQIRSMLERIGYQPVLKDWTRL